MPSYAQVALNLPVADAYDYAVPAKLQARLQPGMRVRVPFGRREVVGYCVRLTDATDVPAARLKAILALVDDEPLVDAHMLDLTRWVAGYYACGWGEALEAALPAGVRHGITSRTIRLVEPVLHGPELAAQIVELRGQTRTRKRAAILEALASADGVMTPRDLAELAGCSVSTVDAASKAGQVRYRLEQVTEHPVDDVEPETPKPIELTAEQRIALVMIRKKREAGFGVILLHGVTGSGKTEIYLRAIADVVAEGKQAIVLVPEISLTPQTIRRFKARFDRLAVLHSHLTAGQRYEQWLTIHRGQADVVIGPRSAVFAPTRRLGMIVVDEEHSNTFKQENAPRYHARDVAAVRAQRLGALVILGSATPALESYANARRGRYTMVSLRRRVLGLEMPPMELVDMTSEIRERHGYHFLSRRLERLMHEALDSDAQVLLFLNRRGFSTLVFCPRCQHALTCPRCNVPMVYHRKRHLALCHYCNEQLPPTGICPACRGAEMLHFGAGTERIEDEIAGKFPSYPVVRMDSDTTRGRSAHQELLDRFRSGAARILVGTQMIAKGLDFPQITLVGVISADTALYQPDFRAAERTFQLVEQVAGRAGRGLRGGRVVVQTTNPQHLSLVCAAKHDYLGFAEAEMKNRHELGYPPFGHLLRVLIIGPDRKKVEQRAGEMEGVLARLPESDRFTILGPVECPLAMLQGKHRWQILIKGQDRQVIGSAARALRSRAGAKGKVQVSLDVDPVSML
ncbi:primosomal protein N' [bacterium]|nr:primosomal protein N' [bacterium]